MSSNTEPMPANGTETALAKREGRTELATRTEAPVALERLAYEPRNLAEAFEVAKTVLASGLLPRAIDSVPKAVTLMMQGKELGLSAMQAIRGIHVIDGKPGLDAQLMLALINRSGLAEYIVPSASDEKGATWKTKRRGQPEVEMSFTMEDAQRAGLLGKDNWKKFPRDMLRWRALSALARTVYPDVIQGMHTPDEIVSGYGEVIDVGTATSTPAAATGVEGVKAVLAAKSNTVTVDVEAAPSKPTGVDLQKQTLADLRNELIKLVGLEKADFAWQRNVGTSATGSLKGTQTAERYGDAIGRARALLEQAKAERETGTIAQGADVMAEAKQSGEG